MPDLNDVEKPGRYIGLEFNAYRKSFDHASVRFALAFPDVYEIGLSHLGLQLLYHQLNRTQGVMADRVYAPWPDYEAKLRNSAEPLRGIESERALFEFDFLGVSLQYELSYSNILTVLDLGQVPLYARERNRSHPFVIGGGPCAFNPEPLADFFDFFVLGEAEEVLPEIIDRHREWKRSREGSREEFLAEVRKIAGIYVPAFFDVFYNQSGVISAVVPKFDDYTGVVKRVVSNLDQTCPIPERPLVPLIDIVHNRLALEIARGCTRGCRFCQASFIYRPVRERRPRYVLESAKMALDSSGYEEVALLSLSTGDYCRIHDLLGELVKQLEPRKIAVSFPSMRVGTLTPELMEHIKKVRKTGFTLAPEAGSERLRRIINKQVSDDNLLDAAEAAFDMGWRLIKLYFMMGLPGETEADRDALVNLSLRVWEKAKKTRSSVNISISSFVPKPMTPFQWSSQMPGEQMEDCLQEFKKRLRRPGLRLRWNLPANSIFEAVFARGSRRLGPALKRAWELGARFDGWSDHFKEAVWYRALAETGLSADFYARRRRDRDEVLPWDHLSAGVLRQYLWNEYEKAMAGDFTADCRQGSCTLCGVCDHDKIFPLIHEETMIVNSRSQVEIAAAEGISAPPGICGKKGSVAPRANMPAAPPGRCHPQPATQEFLYRVVYSKLGKARFFGQLEIAAAFERAIRRAGLPVAFTKGHHPHVRISFGEALPLGMETIVAEAYVVLTENIDPALFRECLDRQCNGVINISMVNRVDRKPPLGHPSRGAYLISGLNPFVVRHLLDRWPRCGDNVLTKKTKKGQAKATLGHILLDMRKAGENSLEMDIFETPLLCFRPMAILENLAGAHTRGLENCLICKIGKIALDPMRNDYVGGTHH